MNVLHRAKVETCDGFDIVFEAIQPKNYPPGITEAEAEAIVSNDLVCFKPHVSAMKNGYTIGLIQCETEIMADYDLYYNHPLFKELVTQAVIEAQITLGEAIV